MMKFIKEMIEEAPIEAEKNDKAATPTTKELFTASQGQQLNMEMKERVHRTITDSFYSRIHGGTS